MRSCFPPALRYMVRIVTTPWNSFSATRENFRFPWNLHVHYRDHRSPLLDHILSQISPSHIPPQFILMFSSSPRSSKLKTLIVMGNVIGRSWRPGAFFSTGASPWNRFYFYASYLTPWLIHGIRDNFVSTVSGFEGFSPRRFTLQNVHKLPKLEIYHSTRCHILDDMWLSLQQGSYFCTVWVRSVFHVVSLLPTATLSLMYICLLDNKNVVAYLPITDHKPLLWIVKERSVRLAFISLSCHGVLATGDILSSVCACLSRVSQDGWT
jgi:hypothetical protein